MAKRETITLRKQGQPIDPLADIAADPAPPVLDDAAIAEYLRSKGFVVAKEIPVAGKDTTEHVPTAPSNPFDLSKIPPPGERNSAPVQVAKGKWGNPRFFAMSPPNAAPQPTHVPPKGR